MTKKPLTPKQNEALDLDHDGKAGGSLPKQGQPVEAPADHEPNAAPPPAVAEETLQELADSGMVVLPPEAPPPAMVEEAIAPPPPPKPTVGRIVHYYPNRQDGPYAAIITGVHDDVVDLTVFHKSFALPRTDVPHLDDLDGDGLHWVWPPRA